MNLLTALLTPFALLLPASGAVESVDAAGRSGDAAAEDAVVAEQEGKDSIRLVQERPAPAMRQWQLQFVSRSFEPESAYQVRIEESITIRIAPRPRPNPPPQVRPNMLVGVPDRALGTNFVERRMGKCVPVGSIAGVQPGGGGNLILYLRDRRMVRAELERSCRARDYYSGFYLAQNSDGRLCVNRDSLQSRSGANCKLTSMRQLIEAGN